MKAHKRLQWMPQIQRPVLLSAMLLLPLGLTGCGGGDASSESTASSGGATGDTSGAAAGSPTPGMSGGAPGGMPGMAGGAPGGMPGMAGGAPGGMPGMAGGAPGGMPGMAGGSDGGVLGGAAGAAAGGGEAAPTDAPAAALPPEGFRSNDYSQWTDENFLDAVRERDQRVVPAIDQKVKSAPNDPEVAKLLTSLLLASTEAPKQPAVAPQNSGGLPGFPAGGGMMPGGAPQGGSPGSGLPSRGPVGASGPSAGGGGGLPRSPVGAGAAGAGGLPRSPVGAGAAGAGGGAGAPPAGTFLFDQQMQMPWNESPTSPGEFRAVSFRNLNRPQSRSNSLAVDSLTAMILESAVSYVQPPGTPSLPGSPNPGAAGTSLTGGFQPGAPQAGSPNPGAAGSSFQGSAGAAPAMEDPSENSGGVLGGGFPGGGMSPGGMAGGAGSATQTGSLSDRQLVEKVVEGLLANGTPDAWNTLNGLMTDQVKSALSGPEATEIVVLQLFKNLKASPEPVGKSLSGIIEGSTPLPPANRSMALKTITAVSAAAMNHLTKLAPGTTDSQLLAGGGAAGGFGGFGGAPGMGAGGLGMAPGMAPGMDPRGGGLGGAPGMGAGAGAPGMSSAMDPRAGGGGGGIGGAPGMSPGAGAPGMSSAMDPRAGGGGISGAPGMGPGAGAPGMSSAMDPRAGGGGISGAPGMGAGAGAPGMSSAMDPRAGGGGISGAPGMGAGAGAPGMSSAMDPRAGGGGISGAPGMGAGAPGMGMGMDAGGGGMLGGAPGMGAPGGGFPGGNGAPSIPYNPFTIAQLQGEDLFAAAMFLWSPKTVDSIVTQLQSASDLATAAEMLTLSAAIPSAKTRHMIFEAFTKGHEGGADALTSLGLFAPNAPDPALLVVLKSLPRQRPTKSKSKDEAPPMDSWTVASQQMVYSLRSRLSASTGTLTANTGVSPLRLHKNAVPEVSVMMVLPGVAKDFLGESAPSDTRVYYTRTSFTPANAKEQDQIAEHYVDRSGGTSRPDMQQGILWIDGVKTTESGLRRSMDVIIQKSSSAGPAAGGGFGGAPAAGGFGAGAPGPGSLDSGGATAGPGLLGGGGGARGGSSSFTGGTFSIEVIVVETADPKT